MSIQMYLASPERRAGQMPGSQSRAFVVHLYEYSVLSERNTSLNVARPQRRRALRTSMRRTPGSKGYMPDGSSLKAVQFPPLNKETVLDRILERPHTVEGIALHLEVVLIRFREDAGGKYCVTVVDEDLD